MQITQRAYPSDVANHLKSQGLSALLARLYASRGITDASEVRGSLSDLIHYSELKNAKEMANHLADAIIRGERLLVIADYDCDGATACSVMLEGLSGMGADIGFLVPDRMVHGYGLTPSIIDEVAKLEKRPRFIITVDNGISSVEGVAAAAALGIDVLVTDHHLPGATLPAALCIVNPSQPGCTFASKSIAGCGVAWYVVWATVEELEARGLRAFSPDFTIEALLPYVAVGTVADVVTLDRNNRILVQEGISRIRTGNCPPGIGAIAKVAGKDTRVLTTTDIGFSVGPRINAAGRLENMTVGIDCLTSYNIGKVVELAASLHAINKKRQEMQGEIVDQAAEQILNMTGPDALGVSVYSPNWHEGVVGIVAGRVKEQLHRPVFVLTDAQDGNIKGSGRSIPGFHLKHALDLISARHPGLLHKYGGHAMAAGLTLGKDGLDTFREAFVQVCREQLTTAMLNRVLETDGELSASDMTIENAKLLRAEVWGQGFLAPVFEGTFSVIAARLVGEKKNHLKLTVLVNGNRMDAMKFFYEGPVPTTSLRVAYTLSVNEYNGRESVQMLIDHMEDLGEVQLAA